MLAGFVTHAHGAWRCGHDAIVEHLMATVDEETVERTHRRIAAAKSLYTTPNGFQTVEPFRRYLLRSDRGMGRAGHGIAVPVTSSGWNESHGLGATLETIAHIG